MLSRIYFRSVSQSKKWCFCYFFIIHIVSPKICFFFTDDNFDVFNKLIFLIFIHQQYDLYMIFYFNLLLIRFYRLIFFLPIFYNFCLYYNHREIYIFVLSFKVLSFFLCVFFRIMFFMLINPYFQSTEKKLIWAYSYKIFSW